MSSDTTSRAHTNVTAPANLRVVARRDFLVAGAALAAGASLGMNAPARAETAIEQAPAAAPAGSEDLMHMREALRLMREAGVIQKTGGPFGAVLVLDGKVLATSGNSVMRDHDPTAHAEVNAIRAACRAVASPHIDGAVMYSSCEPCPMCYATAYWARVGKIFYGASYADYADLFDDANIQSDLTKPYTQRQVAMQQILRPEAQVVWQEFRQLPDRARY
jgi:tRNA(Arg) A34 adenosine deaminase TadA